MQLVPTVRSLRVLAVRPRPLVLYCDPAALAHFHIATYPDLTLPAGFPQAIAGTLPPLPDATPGTVQSNVRPAASYRQDGRSDEVLTHWLPAPGSMPATQPWHALPVKGGDLGDTEDRSHQSVSD